MFRILIVDDTASHCLLVSRWLTKHGFEVLTAKDAELGIDLAQEKQPDLILMDVVMPGINGFEATRALKSRPQTANIPVVLLSSKQSRIDKAWGLQQGASAYLVKPIQESVLMDMVERVLQKPVSST